MAIPHQKQPLIKRKNPVAPFMHRHHQASTVSENGVIPTVSTGDPLSIRPPLELKVGIDSPPSSYRVPLPSPRSRSGPCVTPPRKPLLLTSLPSPVATPPSPHHPTAPPPHHHTAPPPQHPTHPPPPLNKPIQNPPQGPTPSYLHLTQG